MSRFTTLVRRFHADESGNEALQTVAILAVGAMVLVGLHTIWENNIRDQVTTKLFDLFGVTF